MILVYSNNDYDLGTLLIDLEKNPPPYISFSNLNGVCTTDKRYLDGSKISYQTYFDSKGKSSEIKSVSLEVPETGSNLEDLFEKYKRNPILRLVANN